MRKHQTAPRLPERPSLSSDPACSLIQLRAVNKLYHTPAGDFVALKDVNLCFGEGEFVGIIGKSGSGKSTLINMISGIDHPTSGGVRVGNAEIHTLSEGQLAVWRGRTMGIVFQFFQLLPMLSVLENTILPMDYCNMYDPMKREERAMALLKLVGLEHEADSLPAALSAGQQQIAAIARSLANDPPIIVADEPTGNLDSKTAENVLNIFDDLVKQGKTILIVTHDSALAARATRRILISDGQTINESVSNALPDLPHPTLLQISNKVQARCFAPGEWIAQQGGADPGLLIITSGSIEVFAAGKNGDSQPLERLTAGQFFSDLEMAEPRGSALSIRASSNQSVEALWLEHKVFHEFLNSHPGASHYFAHLAQERALACASLAPQVKQAGRSL